VPTYVLVLEAAAAMLLPILVAVPVVRSAVRITVREALDPSGGTAAQNERGLIDRLMARVQGLPRPLLLSLRNTFRRKGRLLRTLLVLTLGGAIFMSVLTVRASLINTLDEIMATKNYGIEVRLARPYHSAVITQHMQQVPGVVRAEGWHSAVAYPVHADGSEGDDLNLFGMPAESDMLNLNILQGRWLHPADRNAIVLSSNFFSQEPDMQVGDDLVLNIDGEEYTWRIVGISQEFTSPVNPATGYVTDSGFAEMVGGSGRVQNVRLQTTTHDQAFLENVTQRLEDYADQHNLQFRLVRNTFEDAMMLHERFNILTTVLSMMASLIGIVGGLGLMGTMSINVIERTKEIGIMRAVGASDGAVQQIVIVEGVLIGLLAWAAGVVLSLPISRLMSYNIGNSLLDQPLSYQYALYTVPLWLAIVVVVAALASYVPARNASRLTVREVLAYE
jgi:putative ABC transport system permease protein